MFGRCKNLWAILAIKYNFQRIYYNYSNVSNDADKYIQILYAKS